MKEPGDRIYFLDGTHPVHNNKPCYGWIYKGDIKTSLGNSGRNAARFINRLFGLYA
jgi:hypothetical protein